MKCITMTYMIMYHAVGDKICANEIIYMKYWHNEMLGT